ncbi:XRE family transcriptional regulator [Photobacterium damselae subsp. damselae]|uniref:helix-turn-helix domain-containing protein n=1 Tax=Photobacterium damselae TaxID=38293 RepID=UPI001F36B841|nr:XRE family transcriptional regulator [Photobacterium damselae]UJZ93536.1 XRE family transcriptional regulator [Photobacterium damselae subsp. damselae]UJZ97518.1 XRE family transcriptional regulator [Photobacterium damselae subsp. damselae]
MFESFVGERLRLARTMKGYTLQDVGDAVFASRQSIHQYEGDARTPPDDVVGALAEFLGVTIDFFYMPLSGDVKAEQCHFRKRKTTPAVVTNRVLSYSTVLEQLVGILHDNLELPENRFNLIESTKIPELTAPIIEKIAEGARKYWGLPHDAPIDNMIDVAENAGAIVTCFDSVSDKVDALSVDRKYPIIIRNNAKESVCRLRFDIAHECGHLVMHNGIETGCKRTEKEADMFASAFLFPRDAFAVEFPSCLTPRGISWNRLYDLKQRWKMSARAIVYRAHFLGFISAQQYRSANVWFSKTGQTKSERGDDLIPIETPHVINQAIEILRDDLGINFYMLSKKLGVTPETLSEITGIEQTSTVESPFDDVVVPFNF